MGMSILEIADEDTLGRARRALMAHYDRLGDRSISMRFMGRPSREVTHAVAMRASPVAIVMSDEPDGPGFAEIHDMGDGRAEIAVSVEDGHQGGGIGRKMFREAVSVAASHGFSSVIVTFLSGNRAMSRICSDAGGVRTVSGGEVRVEISLDGRRQ